MQPGPVTRYPESMNKLPALLFLVAGFAHAETPCWKALGATEAGSERFFNTMHVEQGGDKFLATIHSEAGTIRVDKNGACTKIDAQRNYSAYLEMRLQDMAEAHLAFKMDGKGGYSRKTGDITKHITKDDYLADRKILMTALGECGAEKGHLGKVARGILEGFGNKLEGTIQGGANKSY